ncbi:MAG: hypothetical protein J7494_06730 [Sphingobium sp.]|nr:hypothetical protein [Sphingobium sp.]
MDSAILILVTLLGIASAVPLWLLLARLGARQNGRLAVCLLPPLALCFTTVFHLWLAGMHGTPDPAELRGGWIIGFFVSALIAAIPALVGVGIGFLLESRYGDRAP